MMMMMMMMTMMIMMMIEFRKHGLKLESNGQGFSSSFSDVRLMLGLTV